MPYIRLVNVTKRFGRVTAINRVTLEIRDGEYICVLGPTGSGKTTLLKLIAGLVKPDEGEIYIDDKLVNKIPPQERSAVYVPQQYALFPHMTVIENVAFGPLARGLSKEEAFEKARKMLELTRLAWRAESFPNELSGGMQQRVALARGLASGAEILLLDEPLGALDARLRVELREKLRELVKESNLTAVHVTHDQEEALSVADRLVVLREGEIQQAGESFELYKKPSSIFVANFVGGSNFLEGVVVQKDKYGSLILMREGLKVRVRDVSHSLLETVVVSIREESIKIGAKPRRGINSLPGEVRDVHFLGLFLLYNIRLKNGDLVNCKVPVSVADEVIPKKAKVFLHFSPDETIVYPYPPQGLFKEIEAI